MDTRARSPVLTAHSASLVSVCTLPIDMFVTFHMLSSPDYIDLFLIHDPFSGAERRLATYRALQDARTAGKVRTVGVSN